MSAPGFNVALEEVQRYDWQAVITADSRPTWEEYSRLFSSQAQRLSGAGDALGERVFRFLSAVTSMSAAFGREGDPFQPMLRTPTGRSAALEDFSAADAKVLRQLTPVSDDPEIRARFADVACCRKFSPEMAREAVGSYLAAATVREDFEHWPRFHIYLLRASQLAQRLGWKNQPFIDVEKHVEDTLKRASSTDVGLCCVKLLELVAEFGFGDAAAYAMLAEEMAERLENAVKFDFAGRYWTVAADLNREAKRPDDVKRCRLRAAETHILEADMLEKAGTGGISILHHLSSGLEALRRAGAEKDRIDGIHQRLLRAEKQSLKEMKAFSHEVDISELKAKARAAVSGCDLRTALVRLGWGFDPLDPSKVRAEVEEHAKQFPFQALIPASIVDHEGRVIGQRPSMFTDDPRQYEAALEGEMLRHVTGPGGELPFRVSAFIEPAMTQIFEEYRPDWRDLIGLVRNNPFVPPGHEEFFVRGIFAGFTGDLVAVAQYLAPQVENSVRFVLEQNGIITSKFEEQIQEVKSLDGLLRLPQTLELFGAGHIFELRAVLTEPLGWNLRNRVAHGLLTVDECYTPASLMLWWVIVRFCTFPLVANSAEQPAPEPQQQ